MRFNIFEGDVTPC